MEGVELRLLRDGDSIADLTSLLNRAYAPLAAAGMRFVASWQGEDVTRERIASGECWVAERGGVLVGTVLFREPARAEGCAWYDRPDVACFGQFAVEPALQGRGLGGRLLDHVERRAVETGAAELALDTSERASALIALYARRGYRLVDRVRWPDVNYASLILSKRLRPEA